MNYYAAREVKDAEGKGTGLFHYTCYNDNRKMTWPAGYCNESCQHNTKEEAEAHYKEYLLNHVRFHDDNPEADSLQRCQAPGCQEFTSGSGHVAGRILSFDLCRDHRNRQIMEQLITVGESFGSV